MLNQQQWQELPAPFHIKSQVPSSPIPPAAQVSSSPLPPAAWLMASAMHHIKCRQMVEGSIKNEVEARLAAEELQKSTQKVNKNEKRVPLKFGVSQILADRVSDSDKGESHINCVY